MANKTKNKDCEIILGLSDGEYRDLIDARNDLWLKELIKNDPNGIAAGLVRGNIDVFELSTDAAIRAFREAVETINRAITLLQNSR